jgi:hypothetical protein
VPESAQSAASHAVEDYLKAIYALESRIGGSPRGSA